MSLTDLLNKPCLIVSRSDTGDVDELGNEIPSEVSTETVCDLQQQQRSEAGAEGEVSDTVWKLYLPSGTAIDTGDAVIVGGRRYEMVGDPWDASQELSPSLAHVEATVRRVAGEDAGS